MDKSASNGSTQMDCRGRTDAFPVHMWAWNAIGRTATTVVGCPRMSEPGPQVSEPKKSHVGATQKIAGDYLPTDYCYTILPLLVVAAPPSSSCRRLQ
jgi:hypothetical protein